MYRNELIDWELMNDVLTTPERSSFGKSFSLVRAVQNKIENADNEKPFDSLCEVLKSCQGLENLAFKMIDSFGKFFVYTTVIMHGFKMYQRQHLFVSWT